MITNIEVAHGIFDLEAILYNLIQSDKPLPDEIKHPIFLYGKGDI